MMKTYSKKEQKMIANVRISDNGKGENPDYYDDGGDEGGKDDSWS